MKQSNTYHNSYSFGGILQPLVDQLEHTQRQDEKLTGKEIIVPRRDIRCLIALDIENIHLLITPAPENDDKLKELDLKGLKISVRDWYVTSFPINRYLDISCTTGILPAFRRPFLRYCEDVLCEITQTPVITPAEAVYKTTRRWKKFWSPDAQTEITKEWAYGLIGELLFLTELITKFGPESVYSWTGPQGKNQDFQHGSDLGVEVKTSVEVPPKITCNIYQLDPDLFKSLFIACYRFTPAETGIALPELVRKIEDQMKDDQDALQEFYDRLSLTGYSPAYEQKYTCFRVNSSSPDLLPVDARFPKITERSFVEPPDHRISGIRFTVQLNDIEKTTMDSVTGVLSQLARK